MSDKFAENKAEFTAIQQGAELDAAQVSYKRPDSNTLQTTVESKLREQISVRDFGAVGNGLADDTQAFIDAIAYLSTLGGILYIPSGDYRITSTISITWPSATGTDTIGKVYLKGAGAGVTRLHADEDSNDAIAIRINPSWNDDGRFWAFGVIGGFAILRTRDSYSTSNTIGIDIENLAFAHFDDIRITGFATNVRGRDVLSTKFSSFTSGQTRLGFDMARGAHSYPNAIRWENCIVSALTHAYQLTNPGNCTITGGTIEGCGAPGRVSSSPVYVLEGAIEAGVSLNVEYVYFENNMGLGSDILFATSTQSIPLLANVRGCNFNKTSNGANFYHIGVQKGTPGAVHVVIEGCSFRSFGNYVPTSGHDCIFLDPLSNLADLRITESANYYQNPIEQAAFTGAGFMERDLGISAYLTFDYNGTVYNSRNLTFNRISQGVYDFTFSAPMKNTRYFPVVTVGYGGNGQYAWALSNKNQSGFRLSFKDGGEMNDVLGTSVLVFGGTQ